MAYSDVYERYTIFEIYKGDIKKEKVLNYKQYKIFEEKQFQSYKTTDEYKKLVIKLNKAWGPRFANTYLKGYSIYHTNKIID